MKVMVYCNNKRGLLCIRALEGEDKGKIVARVEQLQMKDVEFKVSQAGRARVLETGRKSIHAGIVGEIEALWGATLREGIENSTILGLAVGKPFGKVEGEAVFYNPRKVSTFVRKSDQTPVTRASRVRLDRCEVVAAGLQ
jgi:hypothetical protein